MWSWIIVIIKLRETVSWRGQGHRFTGHYVLKLDDHLPTPDTHLQKRSLKYKITRFTLRKRLVIKFIKPASGRWERALYTNGQAYTFKAGVSHSQGICLLPQFWGPSDSNILWTSFPGFSPPLEWRLISYTDTWNFDAFLTTHFQGNDSTHLESSSTLLAYLFIWLIHNYCSSNNSKFQLSPSNLPSFMGGLCFSHSEPPF